MAQIRSSSITHLWGQAPRSNLSAGARPQSKVLNIAAATYFVMKGVAAARFWYRSRVVNFPLGPGPEIKYLLETYCWGQAPK